MIHESRVIATEGDALLLNPFAFWPDIASRLVGLGGSEAGENPDYVLHTLYVSCGAGPILFTLRFAGLKADRGTLILRVHELPEVMGAHARQIALSQTQLTELIRNGGTVSLGATARPGHHYAILGYIYGDTVATADELAVEVVRRTPDPNDPLRPTAFRAEASRVSMAPQIVGEREGVLATPVSQLCTAQQLAEPVFKALLDQLGGLPGRSRIDRWEQVFLARVLDRYDVARSGARGLGIGALDDAIAPWLVQHGCSLLLTIPNDPPADLDLSPQVEVRRLDPLAIDEIDGFDFAWATRAGGVGGRERQEVLRFIEDSLRALKPAGLLTLVVPIDVAPRPIGEDSGPMLRRPDIDRTVLLLLSRGHQVAQICPWGDAVADADESEALMVSAFGLIVRKAA
ncbi:hypothetical protein [Sphingomonas bacterium]|uniref:hypothetical protein n=1 Tax=Sphingomonas bacterium TaxID=1895847 RepID=UPI0015750196|nr:hypothetical protein [Sphingomonas bacterium]